MISRGSEWHRWEPHIHAPGTILNNQFGTADPWAVYLETLEGLTPKIEAIAITDYYVTDTYEEFLKHKAAGRLPGVALLFPNIELRLDVAAKTGFVNVHLLVDPEDPNHLFEVQRILKRLQFHAFNDCFDCTREELIKLGKCADPAIIDDGAALRHGATQFKVNFDQLRKVISESEWCVRLTDASVASESLAERKRRTTNFHREPCAGHREVSGEASAAACMGRAIEPRNFAFRMCRDRRSNRRQQFQAVMVRRRKASRGPRTMARTEALHRDLRGLQIAPLSSGAAT